MRPFVGSVVRARVFFFGPSFASTSGGSMPSQMIVIRAACSLSSEKPDPWDLVSTAQASGTPIIDRGNALMAPEGRVTRSSLWALTTE